ncbi:MAG: hypothetical protein O2825_14920, partial [Proteobacteria bacterium]|nr:hypothetical protein [Pseudomonadota bacterium]
FRMDKFSGGGSAPQVIGTAMEYDVANNAVGERYIVQNPDGSLIAVDEAGRRVGTASRLLGSYTVQRDGGTQLAGLPPIVRESDNTFRIDRPSSFYILPADQRPPTPGVTPLASAEDVRQGSIVYDQSTGNPIGRITDNSGHVELYDPVTVLGTGTVSRLPYPPPPDFVVQPQS